MIPQGFAHCHGQEHIETRIANGGLYVKLNGTVYRLDPLNRRIIEFRPSAAAEIKGQWLSGTPRWAYRALQAVPNGYWTWEEIGKKSMTPPISEMVVSSGNSLTDSVDDGYETPATSAPQTADHSDVNSFASSVTEDDLNQMQVFYINVGGRLIALVCIEDGKLQTALVFHRDISGNWNRKEGSSGQNCTPDQLRNKGWKESTLGDDRFTPIVMWVQLTISEMQTHAQQAA